MQRHTIARKVDLVFISEFFDEVPYQKVIEVLAAQPVVPIYRLYLEDVIADFHDGYIESSSAEVIDRDSPGKACLSKSVRQRSGRGLGYQPQHRDADHVGRLTRG